MCYGVCGKLRPVSFVLLDLWSMFMYSCLKLIKSRPRSWTWTTGAQKVEGKSAQHQKQLKTAAFALFSSSATWGNHKQTLVHQEVCAVPFYLFSRPHLCQQTSLLGVSTLPQMKAGKRGKRGIELEGEWDSLENPESHLPPLRGTCTVSRWTQRDWTLLVPPLLHKCVFLLLWPPSQDNRIKAGLGKRTQSDQRNKRALIIQLTRVKPQQDECHPCNSISFSL